MSGNTVTVPHLCGEYKGMEEVAYIDYSFVRNKCTKQSQFGKICHFSHPAKRVESASDIESYNKPS